MSFKWYFWQWVWEVFACLVCSGDRAQCSYKHFYSQDYLITCFQKYGFGSRLYYINNSTDKENDFAFLIQQIFYMEEYMG